MSGRLVGAVLETELELIARSRRRSARAVLVVLAEATGRSGMAWPSVATIARRVELSPRQVRRVLTELEGAGYLEAAGSREGGKAGSTRWVLHLASPDTGVRGGRTPVSSEPEVNQSPPLPPAERGELEQGPWTTTPAPLASELHLPGLSPREAGTSPRAIGTNPRAGVAEAAELERRRRRREDDAASDERRRRLEAELAAARSPEALAAAAEVRARFLKR